MYRLKWLKGLMLMLFILAPLSFGGCKVSCDSNHTPLEEAADEIGDAVEGAGDAIEDATDG